MQTWTTISNKIFDKKTRKSSKIKEDQKTLVSALT